MKISPVEIENEGKAKELFASLGVSTEGAKILSSKSIYSTFKIEGIKSWEANIIKQHLLSLGSDAAIERNALLKDIKTAVIIFGNLNQLRKLCGKLKNQPFSLRQISETLSIYLGNMNKKDFVFKARDKILRIDRPIICGIINVTPDSFSGDGLLKAVQGSKAKLKDAVLAKAESMIIAGADIIDVGGQSTRPFSKALSEKGEIKRIIPVLDVLRKRFKKILISVDTYKCNVAKVAVEAGVDIINDITALRAAPKIGGLIKKHSLGCVLMHMKGIPQTMQINPKYKDVIAEEISFFEERLMFCKQKGINNDQILLDPGIGFGKRVEDNLTIINNLYKLKIFGLPIFLGLSRKSFIGKILDIEVENCLVGTIAASMLSLVKGANVLRVHDVAETSEAIKIASKIMCN